MDVTWIPKGADVPFGIQEMNLNATTAWNETEQRTIRSDQVTLKE
jgi:hypothetical protein